MVDFYNIIYYTLNEDKKREPKMTPLNVNVHFKLDPKIRENLKNKKRRKS